MNYYVYVQGNPVNSVDPSGHIGELEKLYIRLLYRLYIRNTAQRLNLPSLTNLSDDGFSSMIAAKMLMEDATVYADTQPDGLIREISTWPVTFLRDWVRERVEELPPFSGEISWGPANIPLELATQNFEWWQRNYECLGFDFDDVHTLYYETQEWNLLTEFFLGSAKSWLALELQTGEGAVDSTALAILQSSSRARDYWASKGSSRELSAYTIALGVIHFRESDARLYAVSEWTAKGSQWVWVEAMDDAADILGIGPLIVPVDYLPYTSEEREKLDSLP